MEPLALLLGGFFVLFGYYMYQHPEKGRSFVSARTWSNRPNYAERLHNRRNRQYAIFTILFGLVFLFIGFVL